MRLIMDRLFELVDEGEQRAVVIVDLVDSERIDCSGRTADGVARGVSDAASGVSFHQLASEARVKAAPSSSPNASTSQGIVSFRSFECPRRLMTNMPLPGTCRRCRGRLRTVSVIIEPGVGARAPQLFRQRPCFRFGEDRVPDGGRCRGKRASASASVLTTPR